MRILVVSGFLGAGKTTFIKELAHRTREDFSVMENEYGQVGIDGQLLAEKEMPESGEEDAGKLNIWELTEGCICCSMKSDFASSILTIANTIDPEYLIVEPTGVGMLSNVMNNIRLIQYERISLLSPITILDGNSFDRYCQEFPDIYRDQIASAGCVLVSKMEGADRQTLEQLEQSIRQINPDAEIFTTHYSANPDSWWESLLSRPADPVSRAGPAVGLMLALPLLLRVPACLLERFANDLVDELGEGGRRAELLSAFNMSGSAFEVAFLVGSAALAAAGPAVCFGAAGLLLILLGVCARRALA